MRLWWEVNMNNIINLIKERPLYIPRILLSNYQALGITDEELIIIMVIMNEGDKVVYDPEMFARVINGNKRNIMKLIDSLCDKNILSLIIEKKDKKAYEYISLDSLYDKLSNIALDKKADEEIDNSIFSVFENELGRTLSPMEYEKIKEWVSNNSIEMITLALKEAVLNGVSNLNYIDSILNSWHKKGYKTKEDILKDKENYRTKREKIDVFETDWLND